MKFLNTSSLNTLSFAVLITGFCNLAQAMPVSDLIVSSNEAEQSIQVVTEYTLTPDELELIQEIAQHPEQTRQEMYLDPLTTILSKIKSEDMGNREYFAHFDPQGKLVGQYLFIELPPRPPFWDEPRIVTPGGAENCAKGYSDAYDVVYNGWATSTTGHRESMLGLPRNGVFQNEAFFGVGKALGYGGTGNFVKQKTNYWTLQFANTPGGINDGLGDGWDLEISLVEKYKVYFPDGVTPVNRWFNWVTSSIAGIERTHINADMTYESEWFGSFSRIGGEFYKHQALGMIYSAGTGNFWVKNQGWISVDIDNAPHYWAKSRGNWIKTIENSTWDIPTQSWIYDYKILDFNNNLNEDWTPDGEYSYLVAEKWQTFVGHPVVVAWDCDSFPTTPNVEVYLPNGELLSRDPSAAYLFEPTETGEFTFVLKRGVTEVASQTIIVLPNPETSHIELSASSYSVNINEVYYVAWSTSGATPIVRLSPGRNPNSPDGVYSNEASGHIGFSHAYPGVYKHSVQIGDSLQTIEITVAGTLSTPAASNM